VAQPEPVTVAPRAPTETAATPVWPVTAATVAPDSLELMELPRAIPVPRAVTVATVAPVVRAASVVSASLPVPTPLAATAETPVTAASAVTVLTALRGPTQHLPVIPGPQAVTAATAEPVVTRVSAAPRALVVESPLRVTRALTALPEQAETPVMVASAATARMVQPVTRALLWRLMERRAPLAVTPETAATAVSVA
jgi:hypothetical protein